MNVHNTMEQIYRHPQNGGWDNYGHSIFHSSREKKSNVYNNNNNINEDEDEKPHKTTKS